MDEQMPEINKKLLEMDEGELPPDGELGSEEFGASGDEVAGEDLMSSLGEAAMDEAPDVHEAPSTLQ
ncbi:MAG: hypothetical protein A2845_03220 [Candidatus Lloydbacteria bacterium RIFCSPHIGHO2_01_FULL_49_22]|uniref:Uncharacterized protein n=1 Tax=Candidatus Lloydbacteria bacterium RIFCSPHIGHO2_01_FULL_49_22 TaxID=1798658 RepID=A0A1G2CWK3_9BACT|nr:MAG: hypothetical protein A2845_03220 [Candidatus Lloydbacteria bacterium RIFCSPHIGHO2_01_FULL_49_22]OGZ08942.1 MAG: hypothetical protein A3C14_03055 [Candidatus Lloydbacteria bacterium RIFCSPHIGHO2_02_FULL_50_18]